MSTESTVFEVAFTSPASATTEVVTVAQALNLPKYNVIIVDAVLQGGTGGALDIYLQRKVKADVWVDWAHFAQLADGAPSISYNLNANKANAADITAVGTGTDTTAAPILAAGTLVGGHPGSALRVVAVGGAGTTAGAAQVIRVTGIRSRQS